jgi:hypothetical protein
MLAVGLVWQSTQHVVAEHDHQDVSGIKEARIEKRAMSDAARFCTHRSQARRREPADATTARDRPSQGVSV